MAIPVSRQHDLLNSFTDWCRDELFTTSAMKATALLEHACDRHLARLYRDLALPDRLHGSKTAGELAAELGFVESAAIALEAMLLRIALRGEGLLSTDFPARPPRFTAKGTPRADDVELDRIRDEMSGLDTTYLAALDFLDFGANNFVRCLRDEPDFMDKVLSGREPAFLPLWHRATNEDPLQDAHGAMGARVINEIFDGGTVLEIGGGTGNGTRHLLGYLAEDRRLKRYVFSDISMSFILHTRKQTMQAHPSLNAEWRILDINKPFGAQHVAPGSVDLIYGVNAAHIAADVPRLAADCLESLREGGVVVFAERLRLRGPVMAPRELTLNLSVYHRTAAIRHPEYRPMHGYLAPENWTAALRHAGFREVRIFPDLRRLRRCFPDQYAGVIAATA